MTTDSVISKGWSFCHTLRDDGVGYRDYLEQLNLKMANDGFSSHQSCSLASRSI